LWFSMVFCKRLPEGKSSSFSQDDWLVGFNLPLWKTWVKVRWDDEILDWMESHKIHVPNHKSDYFK
jgi:hypothetical protein